MMTINFDTITNNYEVIYVIKTVMKYHLKKIDTSFHQPLPNMVQRRICYVCIARNHGWFCSWIFINQIASFMTSANKRWTIFGSIFASHGLRFGSPFSPPLADLEYILIKYITNKFFFTGRCHFQLSNIRITKRFWLAGDDDYLRYATSINHQVALRISKYILDPPRVERRGTQHYTEN
jgi:hypothetical protein